MKSLAAIFLVISIFNSSPAKDKPTTKKSSDWKIEFVPDAESEKIPKTEWNKDGIAFLATQTNKSIRNSVAKFINTKAFTIQEQKELLLAKNDDYKWICTVKKHLQAHLYDLQRLYTLLTEKKNTENPYRTTATDKMIEKVDAKYKETNGLLNIYQTAVDAIDLKLKYGVRDYIPDGEIKYGQS
jgi:hypothetical protein